MFSLDINPKQNPHGMTQNKQSLEIHSNKHNLNLMKEKIILSEQNVSTYFFVLSSRNQFPYWLYKQFLIINQPINTENHLAK